jgi:hypothetical protein
MLKERSTCCEMLVDLCRYCEYICEQRRSSEARGCPRQHSEVAHISSRPRRAPHTSSPRLSPSGARAKQPLYSPCTAQARTPQAWPSILSKVHDSRLSDRHIFPNRTRPPQPRCLPKSPISSSSSKSAGARMPAVRFYNSVGVAERGNNEGESNDLRE